MPRLPKDSPLADRVRNGVIDLREPPDPASARRTHSYGVAGALVPKRTHKAEIEAIRKYVQARGGACYVLHQSARVHGSAGLPDLYILMPDRLSVWLEVKAGADTLSPLQAEFRRLACESGDNVLVGGLAELREWYDD